MSMVTQLVSGGARWDLGHIPQYLLASFTQAGQLELFPSPHYSCLEAINPLIPDHVSFFAS